MHYTAKYKCHTNHGGTDRLLCHVSEQTTRPSTAKPQKSFVHVHMDHMAAEGKG